MGSTVPQGEPPHRADRARCGRRMRAPVAATAALMTVAGLVMSCSDEVSGRAIPVESGTMPVSRSLDHVRGPLRRLLPDRSLFGPAYDVTLLSTAAAAAAAEDLTGVATGATVAPAECRPPAQRFGPDDTRVEVGTDNATRSTVTVEVTRVRRPLTDRRDQLTRCPTMTVGHYGATATVQSRLQPSPPVSADDTMAVDQTVESGVGARVRQSTTTLMAQVGDVRIITTAMTFGADPGNVIGGSSDSSTVLTALLSNSVAKAHAG